MGRVRDQFYMGLDAQVQSPADWKNSFLHAWLKQRQESSGKNAEHAALQEAWAGYTGGRLDGLDYLRKAIDTVNLPKYRKLSISLRALEPLRDFCLEHGLDLRECRFSGVFFREIQTRLNAGGLPAPGRNVLAALHEEICSAMLLKEAKQFVYNEKRRQSKELDMLDAFCAWSDLELCPRQTGAAVSGNLTRQELDMWDGMLRLLRRVNQTGVFLPIRVDPGLGAGLYLVGRDFFPDGKKRKYACYYVVLCPDDITSNTQFGINGEVEMILRNDGTLRTDANDYPDLAEAERWYQDKALPHALELFRGLNRKAPPDCPEPLLRFFLRPSRREDREALVKRGRDAFQADDLAAGGAERNPYQRVPLRG